MNELSTAPILLVDDEEDIRSVLKFIIQRSKKFANPIIEASNGQEGLEIFRKEELSLVISDINMPKMNGLAMGREMRNLDNHIPILYVTAYNNSDNILEALRLGAYDFVVKPFEQEFVINRVEKAMQMRQGRLYETELVRILHKVLGIAYDSKFQSLTYDQRLEYIQQLANLVSLKCEQ